MSSANPRRKAIQVIQERQPAKTSVDYTKTPVADTFGANVFSRKVMRTLLPKSAYKAVTRCLDYGEPLDPEVADTIANAMKDWAISRGATHFTHWFQPMHGQTAEKHDS